jgi:hypothetical protein
MQQHASQLFERLRIYLQETAIDFNSGLELSDIARLVVSFLDKQVEGAPSEKISIGFEVFGLRGLCRGWLTGDCFSV